MRRESESNPNTGEGSRLRGVSGGAVVRRIRANGEVGADLGRRLSEAGAS